MFTLIVCTTAAFVAGIVDSIAGGGGLITLPAMMLTGMPPHQVLGTNKFASSFGTCAALVTYARRGYVMWRFAPLGVACALVGSALGSGLAQQMDSVLLEKCLVFLLPVGMLVTLLPKKEISAEHNPHGTRFWLLLGTVCFSVGIYDGFFGPGTGSFLILAFHLILGIGLVEASGTAKTMNLASNVGALITFLIGGSVLFAIAIPMAVANMAGNYLGCHFAMRFGPSAVRIFLFASISILIASLAAKFLSPL